MQRAAGRAVEPVAEIGRARRTADEAVALVERHRVAEQPVPRRQATGRNRGGAGSGGRGKNAAMRPEERGALAQFAEERRILRGYQVTPQAVADDDDDAWKARGCPGHA